MFHISNDSLDWALAHIKKYGDTDIFPVPFEFDAIEFSWDNIKNWLNSENLIDWKVRPIRKCLTPKHRFGFRIATQLDPIDSILFAAIIYEIGEDIEAARIKKEENVSFSYRFNPTNNGDMYNLDYNWDKFIENCQGLTNSGEYKFVVVADIADFYPRIYFHPLENALKKCSNKSNHVHTIKSMIKQWNYNISYGIPVGQSTTRLLAELVIDDVDKGLRAEGITHCRYVDDFRIFCKDKREGYESLAILANILFENHGLTLQQHKTKILDIEEFSNIYLKTDEIQEFNSLSEKFLEILDEIGIENRYEEIDYSDLNPEIQAEIDSLNLKELLKEQVSKDSEISTSIVRFVLRRLGQLDDKGSIDFVLENIDDFYPVFKDVIKYIQNLRSLENNEKKKYGTKLIDLINNSIVGHLEYHRAWVFNTFTKYSGWNNEELFVKLFNNYPDAFSQRKIILSLGRTNQQFWFKTRKRYFSQLQPWLRRAFLAAASCLPGDEAKHWYQAISRSLDQLEKSIVDWVKQNPF